jgi:peptidoglycan/xylan/chitin deacetylase (PgdA/CDA1 family)
MSLLEIIVTGLLLSAVFYLALEYNLFSPPRKGLPVLMYHNITGQEADGINIPAAVLETHLRYLKEKGYRSLTMKELLECLKNGTKPTGKVFMLTFDDGYQSMEDLLPPLLEKYGFSAAIFIPVAFIGKSNIWDGGNRPLLSASSLHSLSRHPLIEIGLHSFLHHSYAEMDTSQMAEDLSNCRNTLDHYKIRYVNALAYPYGAYPRKDPALLREMKETFSGDQLECAFRIGNRINKMPLKERYEIRRIDIKGTDSFFAFRTKLKKGRLKLFA